jgi:hypothetical protein
MMVAVERIIRPRTAETEASGVDCPGCKGTGLVSYWNEISFFEDRRICAECEAGREADAKMGEIIDRAMRKERVIRR